MIGRREFEASLFLLQEFLGFKHSGQATPLRNISLSFFNDASREHVIGAQKCWRMASFSMMHANWCRSLAKCPVYGDGLFRAMCGEILGVAMFMVGKIICRVPASSVWKEVSNSRNFLNYAKNQGNRISGERNGECCSCKLYDKIVFYKYTAQNNWRIL